MTHLQGMFGLVSDMNKAFGNPKGNPNLINWERLTKQCMNIAGGDIVALRGEAKELLVALRDRNIDAVRDALCDLIVFELGAFHFMGIDADLDMQCVIEALYTRFVRDPMHLIETAKFYTDKGIVFYTEGEFPTMCLKSSFDQGDGEYPKGKFLKAAGYSQPKFYAIPPYNGEWARDPVQAPATPPTPLKIDGTTPEQRQAKARDEVLAASADLRSGPTPRKFMGQQAEKAIGGLVGAVERANAAEVNAELEAQRERNRQLEVAWLAHRSKMVDDLGKVLDTLNDTQKQGMVAGKINLAMGLQEAR